MEYTEDILSFGAPELRDHFVGARVTRTQYDRINAIARNCDMSVSEYILVRCYGYEPRARLTPAEIEATQALICYRKDFNRGSGQIGEAAFYGCNGLTSVEIPNSVTSIGAYSFEYCTGLTSVIIPNSVTLIGESAFYGCTGLTSVIIPNSVTSIGESAFYRCSSLTSLTIGKSVTSIGDKAFAYCNLSEVKTSWENPAGIEIGAEIFTSVHKIALYVPIGTTENYKYRSPWNNFKEIIEYMPGGNEGNEKCATPVISVEDGKLVFTSHTHDAKFYYTIECDDEHALTNSENGIVDLTGTYQISVYAYADGYDNSEIVTATLVWVNPQIESAGIISMEAKKAVLIKSVGDNIQICGTELGETILLFSLDGKLLSTTKASDFETIIPFNAHKGEIYIIKYDDKSIKYKY